MTRDNQKRAAAKAALNYIMPKIQPTDVLGIGTGSTTNYFIDLLGDHKNQFAGAVASSNASATRLEKQNIPVLELNSVDCLTFYIDGADETDAQLHLIKGGGAALTREKIVAANAAEFVCIVDSSKYVETLGSFPLPVEVVPMAIKYVSREITKLGGEPRHRPEVITDNACAILDVHGLKIDDPITLEQTINQIPGVVTNGLFAIRPANTLFLGTEDGIQLLRAP